MGEALGFATNLYISSITPAAYAFSIWVLIFSLQVVFLVYQWLPFANRGLVFNQVSGWNAVLCIFLCGWLVAYSQQEILLSCIFLFGVLICLAAIYIRIHIFKGQLNTKNVRRLRTSTETVCVYAFFSLFASWVLGASVINLFLVIAPFPSGLVFEGIIVLGLLSLVNLLVLAWTRDVLFAGVNVWTLVGIACNEALTPAARTAAVPLALVVGGCVGATLILNIWDSCIAVGRSLSRHDNEEREDDNSKIRGAEVKIPGANII